MKPDVSIVIPNFNGADLLVRNLPSVLLAAETYQQNTQVIVVDDGSRDPSLQVLEQQFPQVSVIVHPQNKGFAEAVHTGISAAQSELIFLLNSDVQPDPRCLQSLVDYFKAPDTFAVSPLIKNEHGKINRHSWNIRRFRCGQLKPIEWNIEQAIVARQAGRLPTIYASGGSVLLRKSMFMALGGFHALFRPFYGEDYDLGLRAWRRGWRSYFEPNTSVTHQHQGSIKDHIKRAYVKQVRRRNKLLLEWMHLPCWRLWTGVIPLSIWQLLGELVLLDKVNVMGFWTALFKIPDVLRERRILAQTQKLSLAQILEQVSGKPHS